MPETAKPTPTRAQRQRALDIHYNGRAAEAPAWLHHWVATGELSGFAAGKAQRIAHAIADTATETLEAHCVIGRPCERHHGSVHGAEAEQLRAGIENALNGPPEWLESELRGLLEQTDARDSLAFAEFQE